MSFFYFPYFPAFFISAPAQLPQLSEHPPQPQLHCPLRNLRICPRRIKKAAIAMTVTIITSIIYILPFGCTLLLPYGKGYTLLLLILIIILICSIGHFSGFVKLHFSDPGYFHGQFRKISADAAPVIDVRADAVPETIPDFLRHIRIPSDLAAAAQSDLQQRPLRIVADGFDVSTAEAECFRHCALRESFLFPVLRIHHINLFSAAPGSSVFREFLLSLSKLPYTIFIPICNLSLLCNWQAKIQENV